MSVFFLILANHKFTTDIKMLFKDLRFLTYFNNFFSSKITQKSYPVRKILKLNIFLPCNIQQHDLKPKKIHELTD